MEVTPYKGIVPIDYTHTLLELNGADMNEYKYKYTDINGNEAIEISSYIVIHTLEPESDIVYNRYVGEIKLDYLEKTKEFTHAIETERTVNLIFKFNLHYTYHRRYRFFKFTIKPNFIFKNNSKDIYHNIDGQLKPTVILAKNIIPNISVSINFNYEIFPDTYTDIATLSKPFYKKNGNEYYTVSPNGGESDILNKEFTFIFDSETFEIIDETPFENYMLD